MQNAVVEAVFGVEGPYGDVVVGFGDSEVVGVENEVVSEGERVGLGLGFEGCELDSAEAAGLPVLVLGGDFDGEDRVGTEFGLEEG